MAILELKEYTYAHSGIKGSTLMAILELRYHINGHSVIKGAH